MGKRQFPSPLPRLTMPVIYIYLPADATWTLALKLRSAPMPRKFPFMEPVDVVTKWYPIE